jgi:hypothetical protein
MPTTPEARDRSAQAARVRTAVKSKQRKQRKIGAAGTLATAKSRRRHAQLSELYGTDSTVTDPAEVLLAEIRRTSGHIEWLREQIRYSDPRSFVRSLWLVRRQSGYINPKEVDLTAFSQAGALWVDLYLKERQHLAAVCRTALAAGLEERRVRLAERQAENLGKAVRGMLYDLGVDPEDDTVRAVVFRWLTAASSGNIDDAVRPSLLPIEDGKDS